MREKIGKSWLRRMSLLVVFACAGSSFADVVYMNDFGTQSQRDEWTISNPSLVTYAPMAVLDMDGDGVGCEVRSAAIGAVTLTTRIDAPSGMVFDNPVATGAAYGAFNSWGTYARVLLSADGVNWDVVSGINPSIIGWYSASADATDVDGYDGVESIWVRIQMSSWHGSTPSSVLPRYKNLRVSADLVPVPEPATMSLVAIGGGVLLRRRKR